MPHKLIEKVLRTRDGRECGDRESKERKKKQEIQGKYRDQKAPLGFSYNSDWSPSTSHGIAEAAVSVALEPPPWYVRLLYGNKYQQRLFIKIKHQINQRECTIHHSFHHQFKNNPVAMWMSLKWEKKDEFI